MPVIGPIPIAATADDGYQEGGSWLVNGWQNLLYLGGYAGTPYDLGLRFNGIAIPQGATIVSAVVELYHRDNTSAQSSGTWYAWAHDNAPQFGGASLPRSVTRTSASAPWTPSGQGVEGWKSSPDLSAVVQEIVNRGGWVSGNSIGLMCLSTTYTVGNDCDFEDYAHASSNAARITIEYTTGGGGTPITTTHDLRSIIASSTLISHDMRSSVASAIALTHDASARISTAVVSAADALATIHTALSVVFDVSAAIATSRTTAHDAAALVQSQVSVSQDAGAAVSTTGSTSHDGAAVVSSAIAVTHDTAARIATTLTQLHDTLADVATLVGYVVTHDTRAVVQTQLSGSCDVRVAVATAVSLAADVLAAVATAVDLRHDTAAAIATQIVQATDTLAAIARQIAVTQDLRAMVTLAGESAAILGDIVTLMADHRMIRLDGDPHVMSLEYDHRLIRLREENA